MLEVFQGKVSLTELLNIELPILNQLYAAKINMVEEMQAERERKSNK